MPDSLNDQGIKWDLVDILLVLSLTFSMTLLFFLVLEYGLNEFFVSKFIISIKPLILNFIQALLLAGLTLFLVKIRYNISLNDFGFKFIKVSTTLKYGIIGGISICLLITLLNNIIYSFIFDLFGIQAPTQEVIKSLLRAENPILFLLYTCLIVIVAPLTEEIFFRGFVYPYCKVKVGKCRGMILNGILFGFAHFSCWLFFPTCLGGVILAWIYEKTESLYSAILAHAVWNMIIVSLVYIIWKLKLV